MRKQSEKLERTNREKWGENDCEIGVRIQSEKVEREQAQKETEARKWELEIRVL